MNPPSALPDVIVLDTCVLISNVLRRLVLGMAEAGLFRPAWSEVIGDEWRRNAGRLWSLPPETMHDHWAMLQAAFPDANQGDVEPFKKAWVRSDPKDWHVIAAAMAVQASHPGVAVGILTRNLRDFNRSELRRAGVAVLDPDSFLADCGRLSPSVLAALLDKVAADALALGKPPEPVAAVLKRERLFRLNKLCAAAENMAA